MIKLANLGRMVAPIHNFDPKWVKKGLGPSKNPSEWPICVLHKNKTQWIEKSLSRERAEIDGFYLFSGIE
jgi:hypothetical protein